ncbi:hypothetical protein F383_12999 [Gossypium arboreum]|uniref:Uncharacterized protein n=1 Tax=Gossypium arboreum TaxID=29729 RepID=A0A0B0NCV7_GOSAR|nr:hypothetical protein F383_12999 [Gossypium arboreum]
MQHDQVTRLCVRLCVK